MKRYAKNIGLNYGYVALSSLNLTHGLWMIYLALRGFSLIELGILEGIYHVTSFLMEVPTGVVADLWGRKTSRIAGRVIATLSLAIMFLARSFPLQALAFVATALGNNLESGAGDALIYDSMLLDGDAQRYMKIAGRQELVYQTSAIIAFVLGGYLAVHSYTAVFGFSIFFTIVAACSALFFREPVFYKEEKILDPQSSLLRQIGQSMQEQMYHSIVIMKKRGRIAFFIVFSELLFCFITVLFFYLQNFWISRGWNEFQIGTVFAIHAFIAGLTALKAEEIERKIGERGVLSLVPLVLLACLWGVAVTQYQALFFIVTGAIDGILIAAIGSYLNKLIPSAQRATILSFQSMVFSLFMLGVFPVVGAIGERWSLPTAFRAMALVASMLCICYLWIVKPFSIGKGS